MYSAHAQRGEQIRHLALQPRLEDFVERINQPRDLTKSTVGRFDFRRCTYDLTQN